MPRNAKEEFIKHIGTNKVNCATIDKEATYTGTDEVINDINLSLGYNEKEYNDFLNKLDFNYDSGYGGQELFGTIWYMDGTWSTRGEYDGSEWWEHHICPDIPKELLV